MAYTAFEFQVIVVGNLPSGEVWANTWTCDDQGGLGSRDQAASNIREFYFAIKGIMDNGWDATGATIRDLSTGVGTPSALFTSLTGTDSTHFAIPTECAIRVSLDDQQGHRGGPFLAGFTNASVDTNGLLTTASQDLIGDAIETMSTNQSGDNISMRVNRPSVLTTVPAHRARVGLVFDVIRRRRSSISEAFDVRQLTQP